MLKMYGEIGQVGLVLAPYHLLNWGIDGVHFYRIDRRAESIREFEYKVAFPDAYRLGQPPSGPHDIAGQFMSVRPSIPEPGAFGIAFQALRNGGKRRWIVDGLHVTVI